ncbi:hypothetical protein EV424DRAFT_1385805 [Suillus variegatus]|nr:hypothetical protein EV424DRAFT_1385805 [Suillus variegatus]
MLFPSPAPWCRLQAFVLRQHLLACVGRLRMVLVALDTVWWSSAWLELEQGSTLTNCEWWATIWISMVRKSCETGVL